MLFIIYYSAYCHSEVCVFSYLAAQEEAEGVRHQYNADLMLVLSVNCPLSSKAHTNQGSVCVKYKTLPTNKIIKVLLISRDSAWRV